ncbi:hypothetical protein AX16_004829 [Volvariella volvacea WC 439]|nr:hypothetical protein AX16_004829 [Volvariella volvacea WC 439]
MTGPLKDVLLVGCGAVGAIYSLILKRSGLARVSVVARSNHNAIKEHGIHFKSQKYGEIKGWRPDRVLDSVTSAADQAYSYVVLTTKAIPELNTTPSILAPLLSPPYTEKYPQPTYVLLQNGINVEVDLYHALKKLNQGPPRIISTSVYIGTNLLEPHMVEHNDFDRVTLGVYRHEDFTTTTNTPEEATLLEDFTEMLRVGGSTTKIVPEIQREKFSKNFWNVAFASYATLTGYTLPSLYRASPTGDQNYSPYVFPRTAGSITNYTLPSLRATLLELIEVGRALGFPDAEGGLPSAFVDTLMDNVKGLHIRADSVHVPSMLLDVRKGQPIEVEPILGEVVRMARARNVSIPRVETLYALLLVVQNQILRQRAESK